MRQSTIKCLPEFASMCPDHTSKVADVLTQMLMTGGRCSGVWGERGGCGSEGAVCVLVRMRVW